MPPQLKTITLVSQSQYESGPLNFGNSYENGSLNRVIAGLVAVAGMIPPEHLADAWCEISSETEYASPQAMIRIGYERRETEEEVCLREAETARRLAENEQRDRAQLAALKARFGEL